MKKPPVKPIYTLKEDFHISLNAVLHNAGMLKDAVEIALQTNQIKGNVAEILRERIHALDAVMFERES